MLWESTVEEHCDINMDCSSIRLPFDSSGVCNMNRVNMNACLHEIANDELSLYEDDTPSCQGQRSVTSSPPLLDMLSPEGSPRRFHIVEKVSGKNTLQPFTRPLKLQHGSEEASASTSKFKTPAKCFRIFNSLSSCSMGSSVDDDYMELFEMEALEQQDSESNLNFPSHLNLLISGQIKNSSPANSTTLANTPEMRRPSVRRCLSMTDNYQKHQPKTPELLGLVQQTATGNTPLSRRVIDEGASPLNYCFKRPDPPTGTSSPVQIKRCRSTEKENFDNVQSTSYSRVNVISSSHAAASSYRRYLSMNDADIMTAIARSECKDEPDLIGDFSRPFVLPLMEGHHRDLKSVSSHTVARLINGEYDDMVASYKIIDCRYPYEYEGGHIRGAKNLYTQEQIIQEFLTQQKTELQQNMHSQTAANKRNIIIFHCEFSSERGPKLSRFLRNHDRARNTNTYPALHYPEIYLLHNGYKEFYATHSELCEPVAYRPMLEPSYNEAYRHFRAKSKSWNGDGLAAASSRLRKSRSRLVL